MQHLFTQSTRALLFCLFALAAGSAQANNLRVNNVQRLSGADDDKVQFTIAWDNSWMVTGAPGNHDAAWVFIKFRRCDQPNNWHHALLETTSGAVGNSSAGGHTLGSDLVFAEDISVNDRLGNPGDHNTGTLVRRASNGIGNIAPQTCTLRVVGRSGAPSTGLQSSEDYEIRVYGIEMVQVKEEAYYLGDEISEDVLTRGDGDMNPLKVTSEAAVSVWREGNNERALPADYPKGYEEFYCMKYEITQGQYVAFLNTLDRTKADNHFEGDMESDGRSNISRDATTLEFSTTRPDRAIGNFDHDVNATEGHYPAYIDWAALRPMTELEYEKACRGPVLYELGEYPWGTNSDLKFAQTINGPEDGTETVVEDGANVNGDRNTLSGGDGGEGPVGAGIFARDATQSRVATGATYYGIMEMAGNMHETIINVQDNQAKNYTGVWGDGVLDSDLIHNESDWPQGYNKGWGMRGGSYRTQDNEEYRISDRQDASRGESVNRSRLGGRGVR